MALFTIEQKETLDKTTPADFEEPARFLTIFKFDIVTFEAVTFMMSESLQISIMGAFASLP
jgi:hypothetical protein